MNKKTEQSFLEIRRRQQAGEQMTCPRCGRDTMKPKLVTNALSRHVEGVYVCDDCGTAEAMLDFMQAPLPLEQWAIFQTEIPLGDFKAVPATEALKTIQAEHIPRLIRLLQNWRDSYSSFQELRNAAMEECPGLTQLWEMPLQALYRVADGEIVIRFKQQGDTVETAVDFLESSK